VSDVEAVLQLRATIERKDPSLPRFVVVDSSRLKSWKLDGTTPVEVVIEGTAVGRRNLKRWGKGRDCWFMDLTGPICKRANVDTGDRVRLKLRRVSHALPVEITELLARNAHARRTWEGQPPGRQRMVAEYVRSARRPDTRARRAAKALLGE
jgi:hypothetical protein